jgi:hypothetical protein
MVGFVFLLLHPSKTADGKILGVRGMGRIINVTMGRLREGFFFVLAIGLSVFALCCGRDIFATTSEGRSKHDQPPGSDSS